MEGGLVSRFHGLVPMTLMMKMLMTMIAMRKMTNPTMMRLKSQLESQMERFKRRRMMNRVLNKILN